jgi:gliding motility-associated-like protein
MLTNDTLICSIDTLKLNTSGIGSFVWSPNYMISSLSSPFPLVSPDIPTTYYLTLTDAFGCINKDSVFVDVKLYVTIDAGKDTTICRTDSYQIQTVSDALSYKWTPSNFLDNDAIKRPTATPAISEITYRVIGNIGKCQSKDSVTIKTVPYPKVVAGKDTTICFGDNAIIYANGSINYNWTPSTYLTSTNTQTTNVIKPLGDIQYIVAGTDTFGCPKPRYDTVWVKVFPKVLASTGIRDTSIVAGQSLQLFGSGGNIYNWSPATGLNNATAQNPIATPFSDIEYKLIVTANPPGCSGRDSVRIKVYQLPPSLYVPTAFSPNKDGLNDIIKPIPLGMKSIRHFKIYNRWGQQVFYTNQFNKGWDGTYKGNPQDPGTFVWEAEAENFKGEIIKLKGTVVLIR